MFYTSTLQSSVCVLYSPCKLRQTNFHQYARWHAFVTKTRTIILLTNTNIESPRLYIQGIFTSKIMKWRTCRYTTCSQTTAFCSYEKSHSFCQLDMSTRFLNAINTDFNPLTPVPPVTGHDELSPFFHF